LIFSDLSNNDVSGFLPSPISTACKIQGTLICGSLNNICGLTTLCPAPQLLSVVPKISYAYEYISIVALPISNPDPANLAVMLISLSDFSSHQCLLATFVNRTTVNCMVPGSLPPGVFKVNVYVANQFAVGEVVGLKRGYSIVTTVSPSSGPAVGGINITLTLTKDVTNFKNVTFTSTYNSQNITFASPRCNQTGQYTIGCDMPAVPISTLFDVTVALESESGTLLAGFAYDPSQANSISSNFRTKEGGYGISIQGINFGTGCCVEPVVIFGTDICFNAERVSDSLITCIAPSVIALLILGIWHSYSFN
jgi:hypothetical protein